MQFFGWLRSKCNISSLDLLKTYAIFLNRDKQLSGWFHTLEQNLHFWYTEIGNFHDDFMFLIEWHHFQTEIGKFHNSFMT